MSENICSICNEKFEDEYFDKKQNKCKLHTKKSIYSREFTDDFFYLLQKYINDNSNLIDLRGKLFLKGIHFPNFNPQDVGDFTRLMSKYKKIEFFQCEFYNNFSGFENHNCCFYNCDFYNKFTIYNICNLDNTFLFKESSFHNDISFYGKIILSNIFENCNFNAGTNKKSFTIDGQLSDFKGIIFSNIKKQKFKELNFSNSIINEKFILDKKIEIENLNLEETIFRNKVKIQFCDIEEAIFYNTKFQDLADFYQTKFKKVNFERTDFEKISVFSECIFEENVDFKYTKFLGKSIFRDATFQKELDLRNTIFDDEANFLDITSEKRKKVSGQFVGEIKDIKVSNRETARIIKNFYDKSNNIIEANRFYKLEMEERENELEKIKNKNKLDWLIFKIHGISSNHSQDWLLSLFWIFIVGAFFSFINFYSISDKGIFIHFGFWSIFVTIVFSIIIFFCNTFNKWLKLAMFYLLYIYKTEDITLYFIIKIINPFQKSSDIGLIDFLSKIIIAYLIYQLIISIRQNTRRK